MDRMMEQPVEQLDMQHLQHVVDNIMKVVADEYGVKVSDIKGDTRKKPVPEARMMATTMMLSNRITRSETSRQLNVHPTSVDYFERTIKDYIKIYPETREHYNQVLKALLK